MNEFSLTPDAEEDIGPARAITVERLQLHDFRNYRDVTLAPRPGPVVLYGENGAGKTNLLEAVSMLSPGRGLRHPWPQRASRPLVAAWPRRRAASRRWC